MAHPDTILFVNKCVAIFLRKISATLLSRRVIGKSFWTWIETTDPFLGTNPKITVRIFCNAQYIIMNERIAIGFIIIIRFAVNAIKPVQPETGSKPDKTLFVLENAFYFLVRQALLTVDPFEPDIFLRKQNRREE